MRPSRLLFDPLDIKPSQGTFKQVLTKNINLTPFIANFFYKSKNAWFSEQTKLSDNQSDDPWVKFSGGSRTHLAGYTYQAQQISIVYYLWRGQDDKIFPLFSDHYCYTDAKIYNQFYHMLPEPTSLPVVNFSACSHSTENDLHIFSRMQYGHFLLDDLLPALAAIKFNAVKNVTCIKLYISSEWQKRVAAHYVKLLLPWIQIQYVSLPSTSCQLFLGQGMIFIPSYQTSFYLIRLLLSDAWREKYSEVDVKPQKIYLSREGFSSCDRVLNRKEILSSIGEDFTVVKPHLLDSNDLRSVLSSASVIISEPGTTSLIGFMNSSPNCIHHVLYSSRCLTDCDLRFFYSGWRYHAPYLGSIIPIWGKSKFNSDNPFSDQCSFPILGSFN